MRISTLNSITTSGAKVMDLESVRKSKNRPHPNRTKFGLEVLQAILNMNMKFIFQKENPFGNFPILIFFGKRFWLFSLVESA